MLWKQQDHTGCINRRQTFIVIDDTVTLQPKSHKIWMFLCLMFFLFGSVEADECCFHQS